MFVVMVTVTSCSHDLLFSTIYMNGTLNLVHDCFEKGVKDASYWG